MIQEHETIHAHTKNEKWMPEGEKWFVLVYSRLNYYDYPALDSLKFNNVTLVVHKLNDNFVCLVALKNVIHNVTIA